MAKYDVKSANADEFIDHEEIIETLEYADAHKSDAALAEEILAKAQPVRDGKTLRAFPPRGIRAPCKRGSGRDGEDI